MGVALFQGKPNIRIISLLIAIEVKGKFLPKTALEPRQGVEVYLYSFLNLGARWGSLYSRENLIFALFISLLIAIEVKGKFLPKTAQEPREGVQVYLYSFFNLGDRWGVCGQRHAPAALPPAKTRNPSYRMLIGPQDRSGRVRRISLQPGFDPRTVQPVASRYTD